MKAPSATCSVHGAASVVARCARCGRGMCDPCFRFFIGEKTACVSCAHELATRRARRASLGVMVLLAGTYGGALTFARAEDDMSAAIGVGLAVLSVVLGYLIARTGRFFDATLAVTERHGRENPFDDESAPMIWLARFRRAVHIVAPPTSAYGTAWIVSVAIAFSALSFPMAFDLPRYVEVEIVLAVTYVLVTTTLARVLYRGDVLDDDRVFLAPLPPWRDVDRLAPERESVLDRVMPRDGCSDATGCESGCEEGAFLGVVLCVVAIVLSVVVLFAWVVVEVALPLAFILCYELVLAAVQRASRGAGAYQGRALASVGRGALIAFVFVAPLGLVTYVLTRALAS